MSGKWVAITVGAAVVVSLVVGAIGGVFGGHKYWKSSPPPPGAVRLRIKGLHPPTALEKHLARAYSPLLVFGSFPDDPWKPGPVATYLCQARLVTPATALADAATPVPATINAIAETPCASGRPPHAPACRSSWPLPFTGGTSCVLDLPRCTLREDAACYTKAYPPSSMVKPGTTAQLDYYTRVIPVRPKVDADLAGPMRRLTWVFQYWFFYPFDDWGDPALHLRQVHEADWEFAVVGVAADSRPLFVGYSHHCFGGWSWFNDPRLQLVHTGRGTAHPVLYVADGSHALYTAPGAPNVDLAHCTKLRTSLQSRFVGIGAFRDHTVPPAAFPAALAAAKRRAQNPRTATRLIWIGARAPWVSFDQPWGEGEEIHAPVGGWFVDALGPAGPAFQGVTWTKPVYTILCSGGWGDDSAAGRAIGDPLAANACRPSGRALAPPVAAVARSG